MTFVFSISDVGLFKSMERVSHKDIYHTLEYCQLQATKNGAKPAILFAVHNGIEYYLPLEFRSIPGTEYFDASTSYGYTGVVTSIPNVEVPLLVLEKWSDLLAEQRVVSVFVRLHPMYHNTFSKKFDNIKIDSLGEVVIVETENVDNYFQSLSKKLRYDLRKLEASVKIKDINDDEFVQKFVKMYNRAMYEKDARKSLLLSVDEVYTMLNFKKSKVKLLGAFIGDDILISGALFSQTGSVSQYLYSASDPKYNAYGSSKLLIARAIKSSALQGGCCLCLGGGVGAQNDSLFQFKSRFGTSVTNFSVLKWIVMNDVYHALSEASDNLGSFFPAYRVNI